MSRIKLHYIYVLIGIATLTLNIALTVHLFKSRKSPYCRQTSDAEDLITFRLAREHYTEGGTTAAVPYDDTVLLED